MAKDSKISWTDHTHNRWWGCSKASPGCAHCYAETWAKRVGQGCFGNSPRRLFGHKHLEEPLRWAAAARTAGTRAKVFCQSMGDLFEDGHPEVEASRASLWPIIRETADALDWLLLTKRPENFGMMPADVARLCWLGVTVEDQEYADERIPLLLRVPTPVRFVSCEPLLGPVDLRDHLPLRIQTNGWNGPPHYVALPAHGGQRGIDWVIVGGESGPHARTFDLAWARSIRDQCASSGVPLFVKQMGRACRTRFYDDVTRREWELTREWPKPIGWEECDGQPQLDSQVRLPFYDRDGRDPAEWPQDLRVQQFPEVRSFRRVEEVRRG